MRFKICALLGLAVCLGLPSLVMALTAPSREHLALQARLNALEPGVDLTFAESLAETQLVDRVSIVVSKSKILVDGVDIGI
ncbi:MAG: hypothetical protein HN348_31160, partial [Proteobacteria bacterium]|nr:hypothetical protein [Pseudomonadota bacterium]